MVISHTVLVDQLFPQVSLRQTLSKSALCLRLQPDFLPFYINCAFASRKSKRYITKRLKKSVGFQSAWGQDQGKVRVEEEQHSVMTVIK